MQSHELIKDLLKHTSAKQISADMNLSLSLIYKWAEPPLEVEGSGASNPLDRISQLYKATQDKRIIHWVCACAGGFYIENPPVKTAKEALVPATNTIINDFAQLLAAIASASADQQVTAVEAQAIRARWEELKSVTETFVNAAEKGRFRTQGAPHGATASPPQESKLRRP